MYIDELKSVIVTAKYNADVLVLGETWLTLKSKDNAVIENYEAIHLARKSQSSEGIQIHFKRKANVEVLEESHVCNALIEACTIKLKLNNISYHVIGV